jgi:hypothetical protein
MQNVLKFASVSIEASPTWREITDQIDPPDPPFTFADQSKDVGALQFSIARYEAGPVPDPSCEDLLILAETLGKNLGLSDAHDRVTEDGDLRLAAVSYRDGEYLIRIWYVSDGKNFAKVTYTCAWSAQSQQLEECEAVVRSLRFL